MVKLNELYRCKHCDSIVEVLKEGDNELVTDEQPLELLEAKQVDTGAEKHVPVIERDGSKVTVKVGEISHPMLEEHYIVFIELFADGNVYRKSLTSENDPKAEFYIDPSVTDLKAREYCSVHGLWVS
jgi:superoxide reductase